MKHNDLCMHFLNCFQNICSRLKQICYVLLFFYFPFKTSAQLWNGNLGEPIVNITFGAHNSQALPYGSTSYAYAHGCSEPGEYSLENYLIACASNTWILLTGDHTRDNGGNYMLVNGAGVTGSPTVLAEKVSGLCGSTTYQFSAWLANCMKTNACGGNPVLPNFTFTIESVDGSILASYTTEDLPITGLETYVEYGVCYTTPVIPQPLVLRIKCNTSGKCGSSFIMDDVTLKPAGPSISITLDGKNILDIDLCSGYNDPLLLQAAYTTGYKDPVLQWQQSVDTGNVWQDIPGANTASYFIPKRNDAVIAYRMWMAERTNTGNSKCTIYSRSIITYVHPKPGKEPLKQVPGCLEKDLVLTPPPYFYDYKWTGPNGFQSNDPSPVIRNVQDADGGLYTVLVTGDFGCKTVDSLQVNISPGTTISTNTLYNICKGNTVSLNAAGDGTYEWTPALYLSNPSIANPVATPLDSVQYKVVLTNSYGCKDSALVNINVFKKAAAGAGSDKSILAGDSILLDGSAQGTAINYYWSSAGVINNPSALSPLVSPLADTRYTLNVSSTVGCGKASDDVTIHVYKDIFLPNAFTPNGDGKNDVYYLFPLDNFKLISFTIFNRYGAKVFSTANPLTGWDGTIKGEPQSSGVYVYYLEMKHVSGKKITRKGSILLLR